MNTMLKPRILFVCLGNICRSPMAEGVFGHLAREAGFSVGALDSAGTSDFHLGSPPDRRAQALLRRRGVDISAQRARRVSAEDFARFDHILAMDLMNLGDLERMAPADYRGALRLFLDYAPGASVREVPDPYYGGEDGFETVYRLLSAASEGLIAELSGSAYPASASVSSSRKG